MCVCVCVIPANEYCILPPCGHACCTVYMHIYTCIHMYIAVAKSYLGWHQSVWLADRKFIALVPPKPLGEPSENDVTCPFLSFFVVVVVVVYF